MTEHERRTCYTYFASITGGDIMLRLFTGDLHIDKFRPVWAQQMPAKVECVKSADLVDMTDEAVAELAEGLAQPLKIINVPSLQEDKKVKVLSGTRLELRVPVVGDMRLLEYKPYDLPHDDFPVDRIEGNLLVFDLGNASDQNAIRQNENSANRVIGLISTALVNMAKDVNGFNDGYAPGGPVAGDGLATQLATGLRKRREILKQARDSGANFS